MEPAFNRPVGAIAQEAAYVTHTDPTPPPRPVHETHVTDNRGSNTTAWVVAAVVADAAARSAGDAASNVSATAPDTLGEPEPQ